MISLREMIEDRDRLRRVGKDCCDRCGLLFTVETQRPYSGAFLSGICRTCWGNNLARRAEAEQAIPGQTSCPERFENSEYNDRVSVIQSNRLAKYIGCRTDVRWYRKWLEEEGVSDGASDA